MNGKLLNELVNVLVNVVIVIVSSELSTFISLFKLEPLLNNDYFLNFKVETFLSKLSNIIILDKPIVYHTYIFDIS